MGSSNSSETSKKAHTPSKPELEIMDKMKIMTNQTMEELMNILKKLVSHSANNTSFSTKNNELITLRKELRSLLLNVQNISSQFTKRINVLLTDNRKSMATLCTVIQDIQTKLEASLYSCYNLDLKYDDFLVATKVIVSQVQKKKEVIDRKKKVETAGGISSIVIGSVLFGFGVALSPVTFGGSLALCGTGTAFVATGVGVSALGGIHRRQSKKCRETIDDCNNDSDIATDDRKVIYSVKKSRK